MSVFFVLLSFLVCQGVFFRVFRVFHGIEKAMICIPFVVLSYCSVVCVGGRHGKERGVGRAAD